MKVKFIFLSLLFSVVLFSFLAFSATLTSACNSDAECGEDNFVGELYCLNDNVVRDFVTYSCVNPETNESYCLNATEQMRIEKCEFGCENGKCKSQIDLIEKAKDAYWENNDGQISWGTNNLSGIISYLYRQKAEDGLAYDKLLFTHPKWQDNGYMQGKFIINVYGNISIRIRVGFLYGASKSEGVKFSINYKDENETGNLASVVAKYDNKLDTLTADLSRFAGRQIEIFLKADANGTASYDWAIWTEAVVTNNLVSNPSFEEGILWNRPLRWRDRKEGTYNDKNKGEVMAIDGSYVMKLADLDGGEAYVNSDSLGNLNIGKYEMSYYARSNAANRVSQMYLICNFEDGSYFMMQKAVGINWEKVSKIVDTTSWSTRDNCYVRLNVNTSNGILYIDDVRINAYENKDRGYEKGSWYKADLHSHTNNSIDGSMSPEQSVSKYKENGFQVLAITDHNYITCTDDRYDTNNFLCLKSYEWSPPNKHMSIFNISKVMPLLASKVQETIDNAISQGGFVIINHPGYSFGNWTSDYNYTSYTGIETHSLSQSTFIKANCLNESKFFDKVLATGRKVFAFCNDDCHTGTKECFIQYNYIFAENFSKQEIYASIKKGLIYGTTGPTMNIEPFRVECDWKILMMGEERFCESIRIKAKIDSQSQNMSQIRLINNGELIYTQTCNSKTCYLDFNNQSKIKKGYVRIEANDTENKNMLSNPIWLSDTLLINPSFEYGNLYSKPVGWTYTGAGGYVEKTNEVKAVDGSYVMKLTDLDGVEAYVKSDIINLTGNKYEMSYSVRSQKENATSQMYLICNFGDGSYDMMQKAVGINWEKVSKIVDTSSWQTKQNCYARLDVDTSFGTLYIDDVKLIPNPAL